MITKRNWRLTCLPLCVICYSAVASADGPIRMEPYDIVINDAIVTSCSPFGYEFNILYNGSITFQDTLFFDKDGNIDRIRTTFRVNGGVYKNSSDFSKFVDLDPGWGASRWIDWKTGDFVQAGAYTKVTVPGYGAIAMGVGRLSVSSDGVVTYTGQADFVEGDLAILCSVLA